MLHTMSADSLCLTISVSARNAGYQTLDVFVNRGSIPSTVKMLWKDVFLASFVPRNSQSHQIDVKLNGFLIPSKYHN